MHRPGTLFQLQLTKLNLQIAATLLFVLQLHKKGVSSLEVSRLLEPDPETDAKPRFGQLFDKNEGRWFFEAMGIGAAGGLVSGGLGAISGPITKSLTAESGILTKLDLIEFMTRKPAVT